jgi:O-antigen ligase
LRSGLSIQPRARVLRPFLASRLTLPLPLTVLAVVAALAPLPLGSTKAVFLGLWCILLALAAAITPLTGMSRGAWRRLAPVLIVFILWCLIALWHGLVAAMPGDGLPTGRGHAVAGAAWDAAGLPLAVLFAFIVAYCNGLDRHSSGRLLRVLALIGVVHVCLAFFMHVATPGEIFWYEKVQHRYSLTGTFLNRNTAATLFGIATVIWCARTLTFFGRNLAGSGSLLHRIGGLHGIGRSKFARSLALLLLCAAAVLATGSRAGTFACLAGIIATTLVTFRPVARRLTSRQLTVLTAFGAISLAGILVAGGDIVFSRIAEQGLFDATRYAVYRDSLGIIGDHFWLGTGPGTFENVYPAYRSADASVTGIVNRAHSTPLEIAVTCGVPFALAAAAMFIHIAWRIGQAAVHTPRGSSLLSASFGAAILVGCHSLVDYSIQIGGCALYAAALIGAGLARTVPSAPHRMVAESSVPSEKTSFSTS